MNLKDREFIKECQLRSAEAGMSLLTTEKLGLSFGDFDLFSGICVNIEANSKIGLIGPNGIGKTSLVQIIAGIQQSTTGKVHLARGKRIGYLRQEAMDAFAERENSIYSEMSTVFATLLEQQECLSALETAMSSGDFSDQLLEEYGSLQYAFEQAGGYNYEVRIQQTLDGLGLGKNTWKMPLAKLSGGQKTRALLARLLLERPDLLILDEPTNHLDIEAVQWLEHTLQDWDGAFLIVSHDRYFLDNTVNTIWEMNRGGIDIYSGNYEAYLRQRQDRWEYYERVFAEEKARLLNEVDFIQRNWVRASTHARALGLLRRLSRELAIVEHDGILALRNGQKWSERDLSVERPLDVVEAVRKVNAISLSNNRPSRIRPRLASTQSSGNIILRARSGENTGTCTIGYPGYPLFQISDLELRRGECAALIGPNGSGKTTFLKGLLGQLNPLEGEIQLGASLKMGYLAQAHDALNGEHCVLDELLAHAEMHPGQARSFLAQYLFQGDDVFKPLIALSGGERARLALAILALGGANFLLLDEPTNHLDIPAQEALQEVLEGYPGTVLLVSHDRYLINRLATQIWELRDGRLEVFPGSYREYILRQSTTGASVNHRILLPQKPLVRDNSKETRKRVQALSLLEERIREQEHKIQHLAGELKKAGEVKAFERVHLLSWEFSRAQAILDHMMAEWESLTV
jgi:ATP-binding cassette subfamily F protein 3